MTGGGWHNNPRDMKWHEMTPGSNWWFIWSKPMLKKIFPPFSTQGHVPSCNLLLGIGAGLSLVCLLLDFSHLTWNHLVNVNINWFWEWWHFWTTLDSTYPRWNHSGTWAKQNMLFNDIRFLIAVSQTYPIKTTFISIWTVLKPKSDALQATVPTTAQRASTAPAPPTTAPPPQIQRWIRWKWPGPPGRVKKNQQTIDQKIIDKHDKHDI